VRVGLIADVHANLPALQATLDHLERQRVDAVLSAGDLVGYGPHPEACVETLVEREIPSVAGNHDLMAIGSLSDERCVPLARQSQRWTRNVLSAPVRDYLAGLPRTLEYGPLLVAHGSVDDPEEYVRTETQAAHQLDVLGRRAPHRRVLVLGHTHLAWYYSRRTGGRDTRLRRSVAVADRALINPGSVGQSRQLERAPRARSAVVDLDAGRVWFQAVAYDWTRTRADLARIGVGPRALHAPPTAIGLYRAARRRVEDRTGLRLPRRRPARR
jgi:predicted phosphodiesterase